ncbi:hypothetical protein OG777_26855 [Micromonospora peucetia]|uniref:Uncharacterized protein n=1 Tax=Micromonospora peucetia TaxID=47871 RepID=A0A1C6W398_9ACTN|nr:hypothetical protein [Micromonospora peucetia]MCX4390522.1 hypothetical protein [Micromonospora peucetia]WSA32188.1 hypothetical protein OIE14_29465 [Micromonospora peucetia]SCL72982.1 hypothetical protein GA0070608_5282 [Micromonospora peucetia]
MTSPLSPRLLRAGLVVLDPDSGRTRRVITLQYNPDALTRGFQLKTGGAEGGAKGEALRITGPPVQTLTLEAELDAADQLAERDTTELGLTAQLAALESLAYPSLAAVQDAAALLAAGTLEVVPPPAPLLLLAFGRRRLWPVRITELTITEEAFDPMLNPIRAKIRLGLRVLTVNDVGTAGRAGGLAMAAHQQLEQLAGRARGGRLGDLGIDRLP